MAKAQTKPSATSSEISTTSKEIRLYSKKEIFAELSPARVKPVTSFVQIFEDELPSLSTIKKHHGQECAIDYLLLWIMNFNTLTGERISAAGMKQLAAEIYEKFYYLKPSDLKNFFGILKETRLIYYSPQEILRHLDEYNDCRCENASAHSHNISGKHKEATNFKAIELERIRAKFSNERAERVYKKEMSKPRPQNGDKNKTQGGKGERGWLISPRV